MKQHGYVLLLSAAIACGVSPPTFARQDPQPDASELPAVRVRVDTLASFINNLAGLRVRIVSGVVSDITSPRVFTLRSERRTRGTAEVAIVLPSGSAVVREGAPVIVTGIARTLLGAEMSQEQPLPVLTDDEREAIAKGAIVVASSVDAPGGVHLVRSQP